MNQTQTSVNHRQIGYRIKEVRELNHISQAQLAEMTDLSVSYISHIENAKRKASLESVIRIVNALGITVDERWLCANDGRLTVFGCRESASRFLDLLRIDHMEEGEPSELPSGCGCGGVQCMRLGTAGLRTCDGLGKSARRADGPRRIVIQSPPRKISLRSEFMR
mgnify:CR=1 FL=1